MFVLIVKVFVKWKVLVVRGVKKVSKEEDDEEEKDDKLDEE